MKHVMSVLTLALSGAVVVSAGAYAAQIGHPLGDFRVAALVGPAPDLGSVNGPRDVISPPSSVDPGMAIDPPQTGAKMPVIRPQQTPNGSMVLPR